MMIGLVANVALRRRGRVHGCVFVHSDVPLRGLFVLHLKNGGCIISLVPFEVVSRISWSDDGSGNGQLTRRNMPEDWKGRPQSA